MINAQRTISRLDGFVLYGSRIKVSLARFNVRDTFWRKKSFSIHTEGTGGVSKKECQEPQEYNVVESIVDKVVLDRLRCSIIGTTVKTISVDKLSGLMFTKGLDDFEEINGGVQAHSLGRVEGSKVPPVGGINQSTNLEGCAENFPEIAFMNVGEFLSLAIKNREHLKLDILEMCTGVSVQESHSNMFPWHVASKSTCNYLDCSTYTNLAAFNHCFGGLVSVQNLGGRSPIILENGSISDSPKNLMAVEADGEQNIVTNRALGDILDMGLGCELTEELCEMILCSNDDISWARKVDLTNGNMEVFVPESDAEPEQQEGDVMLDGLKVECFISAGFVGVALLTCLLGVNFGL
ncbi:hypothetical protein V6N12_054254 [Hibiscus sabdariffa]|uniref:Uncharacterized protein n=1 Tax=Hibiscus sabdariffa TaxID=183260 RepID=A0ABR2D089_9ROSI